ncbi:TPA: mannose-6-phosphate isomerase [Candidatus Nomurabacteria bacterium]|uniref:Mannose-6-phosphate isomerase n=2 Tax=Candidatus Nomuraibacteriota TaxID=1752729 RepID=A0A1F6YMI6_9BACT|nr:MAG: Mannose-6-phosphate isomerase, type II [Parcubacteria group bacterium GW2011_GWC1_42_21]KKS58527.1 MAG: Mannose-6-phosphate isomerase, type II [Candidatus Nomurabacteria bacterium GW2011_GWF1_42_40]KKT00208.1 MAG: Mannose-6-phosphate isomerase, type II [Candidatus Nomurabacteria bacterium GW2011_GWA1_43_17]KKT07758.1 MAG: Mannose-6-phosphate isomerase, type II [Candidatus Nomurabacteria bacterium GW2011_GWB1_43_19]KKT11658.1 MAG: Mannose-6-phosphate isomerase, type II [Candidatus Nomura
MGKFKIFQEERPWGNFRQLTHNSFSTVKVISIDPESSLSLQYHNNRSEFWRVLSGHPLLTIGEKIITAKPGDEFMIKKQQKHRIETKNDSAQLLEISSGDFDEEDIIRIEDKYGRA